MSTVLRRQVVHLSRLEPGARFAFVRDSTTGQASLMEGVVMQNPGPLDGVVVTVRLPGTRNDGRQRLERTEWSGLIYVMPLEEN